MITHLRGGGPHESHKGGRVYDHPPPRPPHGGDAVTTTVDHTLWGIGGGRVQVRDQVLLGFWGIRSFGGFEGFEGFEDF